MLENLKINEIKEKLSFLALPLYFCILVCLDAAFRYLYPVGTAAWYDVKALFFTVGWASIFTAIAAILPRRGGMVFIIATCAFFSIMTLVHAVMYNLFGSVFTVADLNYAGVGAQFFSFKYLKIRLLLIACVILAVIGSVVAAFLLRENKKRRLPFLAVFAAGVLLTLGLHYSLITDDVSGVMSWDVAMNDSEAKRKMLYTEFTNANDCIAITGIYHYTVRNLAVTLDPFAAADRKEAVEALDEYFDSSEFAVSDMNGTLKDKNLIMVMLESIDSFLLTPEYMPNLYAVKEESLDFVNNYTPLYLTAGTFGTEFLSMTGQIPPQYGASTDVYTENAFPYSLPNLFRKAGYRANSFHSASALIYNRGAIHENLGFEKYHSYADMGMDDYMLDSQLVRGFESMVSDERFFSFIITYSGHGPYDDSMKNISDPHLDAAEAAVAESGMTGSTENMLEYTLAVAHAMETDLFVGELMAAIENSGHADDTAVVFYADHYCKYMTDPDFLMEIKGVSERNLLSGTPFFIYAPGYDGEKIEKYVSSVDIYPTVCSLFALDTKPELFVGTDAFSDGDGYVYWRDYSWYDGETYVGGGDTPENETQAELGEFLRKKLIMSQNTVIYDYYRDK